MRARLKPRPTSRAARLPGRARPFSSRRDCTPPWPRARPSLASMAPSGNSSSGASAVVTAAKLRDEALAAAKTLEDEAASLRSSNTERSTQLQTEAELLKSAAAAQERVRVAATALEQERA